MVPSDPGGDERFVFSVADGIPERYQASRRRPQRQRLCGFEPGVPVGTIRVNDKNLNLLVSSRQMRLFIVT
jgi:hypothetical protein